MSWERLTRQVNDITYVVGEFNQSSFEGVKIFEFKTSVKVILTSGIWKHVERELAKKNVAVKTEFSNDEFKVMVILPPSLDWQTKKREIISIISWAFLKFMQQEVEEQGQSAFEAPEVIKKEPKSEW